MDSMRATGGLEDFKNALDLILESEGKDGFYNIAVFDEDVTLDGAREWLISINRPYAGEDSYYDFRTAIFIAGCRGGRYELLYRNVFDTDEWELPGMSGLRAVEDLNGNGIPEIVYCVVTNVTVHAETAITVRILEWDGSDFRQLMSEEVSEGFWNGRTYNGYVLFEDLDGNGTKEIIFPHVYWGEQRQGAGVDCEGGPFLDSSDIWMWDGEHYHYLWTEFAEPRYRFQAALQGDYYAFIGFFREAEAEYLRAVFDESLQPGSHADWMRDGGCESIYEETPDSAEPERMKAYARFRLVELYVRAGRVNEAEWHRSYMRTNHPVGTPGYIYAYLANAFWWGYADGEDISAACARVVEEAQAHEEDVFGPFEQYGFDNPGPTPTDICPFASSPDG